MPAHSDLSVKAFLAKYTIPVLDHLPYSPDVAPCDFCLLPKVKSELNGEKFQSIVKAKVAVTLNKLKEEDFQHLFAQW